LEIIVVSSQGYSPYYERDSKDVKKRQYDDDPVYAEEQVDYRGTEKRQAFDSDDGDDDDEDPEVKDNAKRQLSYGYATYDQDLEGSKDEKREAYDYDPEFESRDLIKRKKREAYEDEGYYEQRDFDTDDSDVQKRDYESDFEADLEAKESEKREVYDSDFSDFDALDGLKRKKRQQSYGSGYYDRKKRQSGYRYEDLGAKEVDKRWLYW